MLRTAFVEIEHLINSRPLTYVYVSSDSESPENITPNHFLIGSFSGHFPDYFPDKDVQEFHYRKQWKSVQTISNLFWQRFIKEYVPKRNGRKGNSRLKKTVKEDDMVLVVDNSLSRNHGFCAK